MIEKKDIGEKVGIEVEVTGVAFIHGQIAYYLKNPQTGKPFDFTFSEDQIFSLEDKK